MSFLYSKPNFNTITLSSLSGTENSNLTVTVQNRTTNTELALVSFSSGSFTLNGNTLTGTNLVPGVVKVVLVEYEFESAYGYRKETTFSITVAEANKLPVNTARPTLSGSFKIGGTITVSNGTWTGFPAPTYSYQWTSEGINITGATSASYTFKRIDAGKIIRCNVTATNSSGSVTVASHGTPYTGKFPQAKTPTVIANTAALTGWTVASNMTNTIKAYPVAAPSGKTSGLSLSKPATGTFAGSRYATSAFKLSEVSVVGFWVYWTATAGSISIRFSSDNFAAKRTEFSWAYPGQLHQGWNLLTVRPNGTGATEPNGSAWVVTGGQTLDETINSVQISLSTGNNVANEVYLDTVFYHKEIPTRGSVVIGFDKFGEESIPNLAYPILRDAGIKAYWAGDGNLIDGATNANALLRKVYNAGWDAISQGMNHPDYVAVGATQLGTDYDTAKAIFTAQGFTRGIDLFSYPLSSNDASTDAMLASKGVKMARSGWSWWIHNNEYNAGPKLLGHGAVNIGGKTLAQAKALVDAAVYNGVTIFLFCHGIAAGGTGTTPPADTLYWYENDFKQLVAYIAAYRDANMLYADSATEWYTRQSV